MNSVSHCRRSRARARTRRGGPVPEKVKCPPKVPTAQRARPNDARRVARPTGRRTRLFVCATPTPSRARTAVRRARTRGLIFTTSLGTLGASRRRRRPGTTFGTFARDATPTPPTTRVSTTAKTTTMMHSLDSDDSLDARSSARCANAGVRRSRRWRDCLARTRDFCADARRRRAQAFDAYTDEFFLISVRTHACNVH